MLTSTKTYAKLQQHAERIKQTNLRQLFETDASRANNFNVETNGLFIDYSRSLTDKKTLELLAELANELNLKQGISDLLSGEQVNPTEHRAALHTALRNIDNTPILVNSEDIMPLVNTALNKMYAFAEMVRAGEHIGYTGKPIRNVINIGIGGSSLGPEMAYEALKFYSNRKLTFRFISNVDPADFFEKTQDLDPEETLFIISSKTFTTDETMSNAFAAKSWLGEGADISKHFVAVSTNKQAVTDFGIDANNMFEFWDWVGGRYSLMSSIGLSLAIAIGKDNFEQLRAGANSIDQHFAKTEFSLNIPVLLGLLSVWYRNFLDFGTEAVLPYSQYLHRLPAYLQQASMESNGKSVSKDDQEINYNTAPILWGEPGTNGQHSFHQLLHQGTVTVAVDFIGFKQSLCDIDSQQAKLNANLLAQAEALAFGDTDNESIHKIVVGNKPSTIIVADKLTPYSLGQIIALYEHKIFVAGWIWDINSFDQFGVELGKKLAKGIIANNDTSANKLAEKLL